MIDKYADRITKLYMQGRITDKGNTKAQTKGLLKVDTANRIKNLKESKDPKEPKGPKK